MQEYFYDKELKRIQEMWGDSDRTTLFSEQYLQNGFSDEDTWDHGSHLASLILPRLKRYKELASKAIKIDFPLDEMIEAFELYEKHDHDALFLYTNDKDFEKFDRGMKAFCEYFLALWW